MSVQLLEYFRSNPLIFSDIIPLLGAIGYVVSVRDRIGSGTRQQLGNQQR